MPLTVLEVVDDFIGVDFVVNSGFLDGVVVVAVVESHHIVVVVVQQPSQSAVAVLEALGLTEALGVIPL